MKRTTTTDFGWPVHPNPKPERRRSRLTAERFRVSIQASPGHRRMISAPKRRARSAGAGGAIAAGVLLLPLAQSLFSQAGVKIQQAGKEPMLRSESAVTHEADACVSVPGQGPDMVLIAAGSFEQGSPESDSGAQQDERPQHSVEIKNAFAIGRCEVMVGDFAEFVETTGFRSDAEKNGGCWVWDLEKQQPIQKPELSWKNPGFAQTDRHPVTCVSWNDARAYLEWLNERLDLPEETYRLPSESEWEYALRAGGQTLFPWGNDSQCQYANAADSVLRSTGKFKNWQFADCDDGETYTAAVATRKANPWGLYDLSGNVWEWVEDCWHASYENAPKDGRAWREEDGGDCEKRSVRGGSWYNGPINLRSASGTGIGRMERATSTDFGWPGHFNFFLFSFSLLYPGIIHQIPGQSPALPHNRRSVALVGVTDEWTTKAGSPVCN